MADLTELLSLYPLETEEAIRARFNAAVNEGLAPTDPRWRDTRQGSLIYLATEGNVREFAKAYDRMGTEVIAAASPLYAWGFYLDDHGAVQDVERLPATQADGIVRFNGVNGTVVPPGTSVGVEPALPGDPALTFQTDTIGTIAGGFVDISATAVTEGSAGNVAAGAISQLLSSVPGVTSVTNATAFVGGTEPQTDEEYRPRILDQYKGQGAGNQQDYGRWGRDFPGVGRIAVIPLFKGPGSVLVVALTSAGGPVSQVTVDGLQDNLDPPGFSTSLTANIAAGAATLPVVSTSGAKIAPSFVRIGDDLYSYTGMTGTSFTGAAGGTLAHLSGDRVMQGGIGGGRAPIGAHVLVRTATVLNVTISATVEMEPGYTLDGAAGTLPLRTSIQASVEDYINGISPGDEIVVVQVIRAIASVTGVHDVGSVLINGSAVNLAITSTPARVPVLQPLVLTAGNL